MQRTQMSHVRRGRERLGEGKERGRHFGYVTRGQVKGWPKLLIIELHCTSNLQLCVELAIIFGAWLMCGPESYVLESNHR